MDGISNRRLGRDSSKRSDLNRLTPANRIDATRHVISVIKRRLGKSGDLPQDLLFEPERSGAHLVGTLGLCTTSQYQLEGIERVLTGLRTTLAQSDMPSTASRIHLSPFFGLEVIMPVGCDTNRLRHSKDPGCR